MEVNGEDQQDGGQPGIHEAWARLGGSSKGELLEARATGKRKE